MGNITSCFSTDEINIDFNELKPPEQISKEIKALEELPTEIPCVEQKKKSNKKILSHGQQSFVNNPLAFKSIFDFQPKKLDLKYLESLQVICSNNFEQQINTYIDEYLKYMPFDNIKEFSDLEDDLKENLYDDELYDELCSIHSQLTEFINISSNGISSEKISFSK